ncbi:hypothetical protein [Mobilicoccus massiliensis]|uniref:hypothetical protein n=1 Tax=Mobilicoccus massiliensis TaxID=1522310 RepID=UPI000694C886|nr:hypothetical protein [Mobilicoccus massiliensis]
MSEQPSEYDDVPIPPEEEDVRISSDETDDLPVSPPDMQPRGAEYLGEDPAVEETIDQRIMQEEPDPDSAYGAPENESGLDEPMLGGDDPDAIPAERDVLAEDRDIDPVEEDVDDVGVGEQVDEDLELLDHAPDLKSPEEDALRIEQE